MIWFTWRQFRIPTWITAGALAVLAVLLAVSGHSLAGEWTASGAAGCHADCRNAISEFVQQATNGANGLVYQFTLMLVYVVPALIGIFWGAPLIARELETGTHRLAWNQSVTRSRWLATKLAVVGAASVVTAGLLSWAVGSWAHHVDHAKYHWISPQTYGARGIVPIGYAVFALALGVTLGMLIRRTVPAMAATLAIYVLAVASMPLWIRAHLVPARHATRPLDVSNVTQFMFNRDNSTMRVVSGVVPDNAWVLSNRTVTPTGQVFSGPADPQYCGENHGPKSCLHWVGTLGLRQDLTYQPASHFWPMQWAETGVFVAVAVALLSFCFWWTRRRLA
ncbi:ABC transporter permease [Rugosimonospora africana]|uniref:Transporter n=1 Tax=Rugosimonospora africana TaxID=556532 RepID=A0A8J3VTS2_9ACTN|nr:ABC transporter permease subunit [Rugosimonospora africana]GIH18475.1 transporter [Rugosimonospora africana]